MDESFGVKRGQHVPGQAVHNYLRKYADTFNVYRRIRFRTKVETAERQHGGGWLVTLESGSKLSARKMIVATGLTSEPFLPEFEGQGLFGAPLFHSKDLQRNAELF